MSPERRFVGLDLGPLPFESFQSSATRFAWRNGILPDDLKSMYTSVLIHPGPARAHSEMTDGYALSLLTGWPQGNCAENDLYRQRGLGGFDELEYTFRYCPICLEECYHSYIFQWTALHTCPIHGCGLVTQCQVCGRPARGNVTSEVIGRLGYRCTECLGPMAGAEPDLASHLLLRSQPELLSARFRSLSDDLRTLFDKAQPLRAAKSVLDAQSSGCLGSWCNSGALKRALKHIVCVEQARKGVVELLGVTFIRWRLILNSGTPVLRRRNWAQQTERLLPVYAATRRVLENWLFPGDSQGDAISGICERFVIDRDGGSTLDWDPRELAYILFRLIHEGYGFGSSHESAVLKSAQLRPTPALLPHWESSSQIPRVAYRAWLLAAYATLYALIRKSLGKSVGQILQLPQLPAAITPSFLALENGGSTVTGGVFFPKIDGMPLYPFVQRFCYAGAGRE